MKLKRFLESYKPFKNVNKSTILYGTGNSECLFFNMYKFRGRSLIITSSDTKSNGISKSLDKHGIKNVVLDKKEYSFSKVYNQSLDILIQRSATLNKLLDEEVVLILSSKSLIQKNVLLDKYYSSFIHLKVGAKYDLNHILENLIDLGYSREYFVQKWGDISSRGSILDVFSPGSKYAYRLDFFGDELDEIRVFDVNTQKQVEKIKDVAIPPLTEFDIYDREYFNTLYEYDSNIISEDKYVNIDRFLNKDSENILDYYDWNIYIFDEKAVINSMQMYYEDYMHRLTNAIEKGKALEEEKNNIYEPNFIINKMAHHTILSINDFKFNSLINYEKELNLKIRNAHSYKNNMEALSRDISLFINNGYEVYIVVDTKLAEIKELLAKHEIVYSLKKNSNVTLIEGFIQNGFIDDENKIVLITENDIFQVSNVKKRRKLSYENTKKLTNHYDLKKGDLVVHVNHGIARYLGTDKKLFDGVVRDYMVLEYHGNDKLFIPIDNVGLVQKYIGASVGVKLSSLNSRVWANKKKKAQKSIELISDELIELYSQRTNASGFAFSEDTSWQVEFESNFEHEETNDQLKSISEIKADMQKHIPMDRLLLGDVGYGKTEVALRAVFKAVMDSKQVVFLVPTTILAEQHYSNFIKRFEGYPIRIAKLSRLTPKKDEVDILNGLNSGRIDIVVGTHKVLNKKVKFKDLGLLVVDEEQRFGVKHKEKIKILKNNLDTLTLSATPIPRTLNMSLSGIRDISLINEPPNDRFPVETYLMEYDIDRIKYAIERELDRGGQVYYIYNKIEDIDKITHKLQELIPDAKMTYSHGRMSAKHIENTMLDFVENKIDVLISTTIIENGIDIKNANTIIIHDSQNLGLSQLYQLRGRVGRWNRTSFCYLFYPQNKILNENAKKRLDTIKEFSEFGAGFKIAIRDLEIRGGGSILGTTQSGHFESVGYELYMDMLKEAIDKKKNIDKPIDREVVVDINISAYIPDEYIDNEDGKIDYYKKVLDIKSRNDYYELESEILDIFGDIPDELYNLLDISLIRAFLKKLPFTKIKNVEDGYKLDFDMKQNLDSMLAINIKELVGERLKFHFGKSSYMIIEVNNISELIDKLEILSDKLDFMLL